MPEGLTVTIVVQILDLAAWQRWSGAAADQIRAAENYLIATLAESAAGIEGLIHVEQVGHTRWRSPE